MRLKFLIISTALIFQVASAQDGGVSLTPSQGTVTMPVSPASSTPVVPAATSAPASTESGQIAIMDYKSVYEAATIEEEVKMAAERFQLTSAQQEMWLMAAGDRRQTEKQAREKLDSKADFDREGVYRGLRYSQNTFYETVVGHLSPPQKQAFETDRLILQEKQKRLAKLPPPPPAPPTVTVAPVDSSAIKEEAKGKGAKKAKKKKKAVGQ